jgi:hypothetical protein
MVLCSAFDLKRLPGCLEPGSRIIGTHASAGNISSATATDPRFPLLSESSGVVQPAFSNVTDNRYGQDLKCMARTRVTLEIFGLGCGGGGSLTVERALARVPGVVYAYANPAMETAYVEYEATLVEPEKLVDAVRQVGFRAGVPVAR